jgi:hypothetical protein
MQAGSERIHRATFGVVGGVADQLIVQAEFEASASTPTTMRLARM